MISGVYEPSEGDVRLGGQSIAGKKPHVITERGVARTFQSLRLFLNMSVKENVKSATYGHTKASPPESILRLPRARREEREVNALAEEVLSFFGERLMGYRWDQPAYVAVLRQPPAARDRAGAGHPAAAAACWTSRRPG